MNAEDEKRTVGEAAARLVEDRMTVGLGTGTTAAWLVRALGRRAREEGLTVRCTSTSKATAELASSCGLAVVDLNAAGEIDLTLDGADEIGPGLALIKGGGAALLREKLVWEASRRCVAIADSSKPVARLGRFALPVEVVAFGHATTARRIAQTVDALGLTAKPVLRAREGAPVVTDSGNVIYDLACGEIADPAALARGLKGLTGVVEHGLFLGLCDLALVADGQGVREIGH